MARNQHWTLMVGLVLLLLALRPLPSWAAASTGSSFYLEDLAVKVFTLLKNVIIPLLLIGLVTFTAANLGFGFVQMGPGLSRLLLAGAILAGGIETILLLVGGTVVTALVLP